MQVRQMKVVLPLLVLIGAVQPASTQDMMPLAGVDAVIEAGLKTWQVPGLALAVVRDGRVILARGYGVRGLPTREPVNSDTLFYTGSATKSFTATLVFEFHHPVEDQSWLLAFRGNSAGEIETLAIDGGPGSKGITLTRMPPEVADHPIVETRDQAPHVDAASVVARCAEAMGGTDRIKALRTLRMEYTPSDGGPAISVEVRRPNLLRKEIRATALILSDGIRASVQRLAPTAQPPRLEPAEKLQDFEMDIARFLPAFFDHPAKYLGLKESGGIRCHVLEVVLPLGPHVTYFIDTATNLVRTVSVELLIGGKPFRPADWTWSDYRPVQGVMYPSTFIVTAADGSVSLRKVKSIEINAPLDESRFRIPTDAR